MLNTVSRKGFTLVELLVALMLAALVFAVATTSTLRQQQTHEQIRAAAESERQNSAALLLLGDQLALLDRTAEDVSAGEARDTALQIREEIAASVNCSRLPGNVTLMPATAATQPTGLLSDPRATDSLWWFNDSTWVASEVRTATAGPASCAAPFVAAGQSIRLGLSTADSVPPGAPVRITRSARYSLYKSGDATWQLGFREWNGGSNSFSAPQPVAGPFLRTAGNLKTGFRFYDSSGGELVPSGSGVPRRQIARLRLTAISLVQNHRAHEDSIHADSVDIALAHASPG